MQIESKNTTEATFDITTMFPPCTNKTNYTYCKIKNNDVYELTKLANKVAYCLGCIDQSNFIAVKISSSDEHSIGIVYTKPPMALNSFFAG